MFARFGPQARRVIELAEDHARALWRPAVGPQHLLLALLAVDDSGAFVRSGLCFDDVRGRMLEASTGDAPAGKPGQESRYLPLRLRSVFGDAFRHAAVLGSREVKPLHLALALVDPPSGEIAHVLRHLEVKAEAVRDAVLEALLDDASREQVARGGADADKVIQLPRGDDRPARTPVRAAR